MKIKFEGLNCPNCAKKLEAQLNKIDGIESAKIDFFKGTIEFESKSEKKALKEVVKTAKLFEPNIKISTANDGKKDNTKFIIDCSLLALGIVLGLVSIFAPLAPWAYWTMLFASAILMGYTTYYKAGRLLLKGVINENLLVTISVFGAIAIGEHFEGLMVIALYQIGKVLEGLAVSKSKKSIEALTNFKPEFAVLLSGDKEVKVSPKQIKIGDVIIVRPGERVSVDGIVESGSASLDLQSLTGESLPVAVKEENEVLSGSIVLDGVLKIKATKKYEESTVNTIINLIETASEKKSKTETFISKITKWYTLGVIVLSVLVFGIVMLATKNFDTAIYRGLIFLVVSCPCAFAISVPLSYFSGLGNASKNGILIKGSNYLDACAKLNIIAFDKTGTITTGEFEIEKIESLKEEYSENDIIYLSSLGEQYSLHPLAKSIIKENKKELVEVANVKEIAGEGVYFTFKNKEYFVGRKSDNLQGTVVELFENEIKIGQITLKDKIKDNSEVTCKNLKKLNIKTVMLSGDNKDVASSVANEVGIDESYGELLPQDKYDWIKQKIENPNNVVGYVGDGLNDAPSLMLASVGFCMGIKGNSASIEASDIVIANDNITKIPLAIDISKYTRKIVWQNIILSAIIKVTFLTLGAIGVTGMLAAVIADVGVTVMAILNSLRALNYKSKK
ncbi:MAG: cadmium-translocating P-type ATPase [Clostridia bacterium]|nr:cadmium-translocating P-type ATPase [Clostridia bacterium]